MKTEQIRLLTGLFEAHAQQTDGGVEYWLARDLQHLLGYAEWRNFNSSAISKAKTACEISGHPVADHFVGVNKMVDLGSGSRNNSAVRQTLLTRGIRPESLPAAEDVKKVERRLAAQKKKSLEKPESLDCRESQ